MTAHVHSEIGPRIGFITNIFDNFRKKTENTPIIHFYLKHKKLKKNKRYTSVKTHRRFKTVRSFLNPPQIVLISNFFHFFDKLDTKTLAKPTLSLLLSVITDFKLNSLFIFNTFTLYPDNFHKFWSVEILSLIIWIRTYSGQYSLLFSFRPTPINYPVWVAIKREKVKILKCQKTIKINEQTYVRS